MWDVIEKYLENRASATRKAYKYSIAEWCRHLHAAPFGDLAWEKFTKATAADAESFMQALSRRRGMDYGGRREASANTLRLRATLLKRTYGVYVATGRLNFNPFALIEVRVKRGSLKRQSALVPFEAVENLVRGPSASTPDGARDRAFLSLLFGAGLRISEARALIIDDIRINDDGLLYLRLRNTKSAFEETQVVAPWAANHVAKLVSRRRLEGAEANDPFLCRYRNEGRRRVPVGRLVNVKTLARWFEKWRDFLGLDRGVTSHSGRVTAISKLLAQGYSPSQVREFSRHVDVRMVELYDRRRRGIEENCGMELKF